MKIRPKDRASWRRWFAWHPVLIENSTVWFEIIERKRDPDIFDWVYSYRTIDKSDRRKEFRARQKPLRRSLRDIWRA